MVFSSVVFIYLFLPCTLIFYYLIPVKFRELRNFLLFIFSILFYAWGEPVFVLIMLLSIVINWLFGLSVDHFMGKTIPEKGKARAILAVSVICNLFIIFVFKYLNFFVSNINRLLQADLTVPEIALPIGISFFTFQAISYVADVYRGHGKAQKNIINVGLYIAFFPQLIAGPIVRYETIAEQIYHRKETFSLFSEGSIEFVRGLCKKVLLANTMAIVADRAFTAIREGGNVSVLFAWTGIIAYTFEIFYDFSGYSEIAIGLGKMFGFRFLPNFNYPYISDSISEFWRRWHMSLGTWFRDYVYFPMGGSRVKSRGRLIFNLFVVWLLTGVWHGANWTFICWGLMYFMLIAAEKLTGFEKKKRCNAGVISKILRHVYTMLFVMLGWVLFRADSLHQAWIYIKTMFGIVPGAAFCDYLVPFYIMNYRFYFVMCILCAVPLAPRLAKRFPRLANIRLVFYAGAFLVSLASIVKGAYNPFIYFNF